MQQILIVEDDPALGRGLVLALESADRICTLAADCAGARRALAAASFDLAIFDVNLPDGSGLGLLEQTRAAGGPPVLLLTANDMETDIVAGLTLGADDYITKPFSLAVLRARVEAALRRNTPARISAVFEQDGFRFDFDRLTFSVDGKPSSFPRPSSGCCACWLKTAAAPCRATPCSTASGRMVRLMWRKTRCRSQLGGCGASWAARRPSKPFMAWAIPGR